jgi:predicted aconitase with swiveling domain
MIQLLPGTAEGRVLKLPSLSLWGGVDPFSGRLTDPALPHCGESVKDRVLMIGEPVGSSSSSAVLLELLHAGNAPVAIVLGRADAIVALGVLVAREMEWATIPLVVMAPAEQDKVTDGTVLKIG